MIEEQLEAWLARYQPDAVAVERVFSQHNVRTVMGTAQAGAIAIVCAARRGLPVALHTPSEVKAAVTGNGRADKAQVTHMVVRLLKLADPPKPADAADALALAICHLWRGGAQSEAGRRVSAYQARPGPWEGRDDRASGWSRVDGGAGGCRYRRRRGRPARPVLAGHAGRAAAGGAGQGLHVAGGAGKTR